jgi:hypothetical protein
MKKAIELKIVNPNGFHFPSFTLFINEKIQPVNGTFRFCQHTGRQINRESLLKEK